MNIPPQDPIANCRRVWLSPPYPLEAHTPESATLPKEAVMLRAGAPVVFSVDTTTSRAVWNFVTLGAENDERVAILDGLTAGATIITGNTTLDHDSPVRAR